MQEDKKEIDDTKKFQTPLNKFLSIVVQEHNFVLRIGKTLLIVYFSRN